MAYSTGGLIQASDFNTRVGGNPTTTANTLNATYATGGGQAGYGQTAVANVAAGDSVSTTPWNQLFFNTGNAASHQGTTITSISNVSAGNTIAFNSALDTNLSAIYASRGNAASQGSSSSNVVTFGSTWAAFAAFTHTVTFANGDAARYFFNSGGQIRITASHANTTAGVNAALNTLCSQIGTVVISGQNSGSRTIASTSYNGVTKIGGEPTSGGVTDPNRGYFGLTTSNVQIFDQNSGVSPYTAIMDIQIGAFTNGVQGSNGDNGSVVTIRTTMNETGANGVLGTGSTVTCTVTPPATTFIANTWGTITIAGSVSGS